MEQKHWNFYLKTDLFYLGNGQNTPAALATLSVLWSPLLELRKGTDRLAPTGVSFGAAAMESPLSQNRQVSSYKHASRAGVSWIEMCSLQTGSCPFLGWK